jgi:glycosyltransferase involved in cell wall biosynthesis
MLAGHRQIFYRIADDRFYNVWMRESIPCAALIPCRNEAVALPGLLQEVRRFLPNILVVDDGSRDATGTIARNMDVECFRLCPGQGKGAALQAGFQRLEELGFSHALTLDGDGQHSPEDIPRFLACGRVTEADLVVGSRIMSAGAMPWSRRIANRAMSACLSFYAGCALPDSQCGFRLVDLRRAREAGAATRHFEFESEMLVKFVRRGFRVEFVPIQTIYHGERSKICPLSDTWRWLRWYASAIRETTPGKSRKRLPFLRENSVCAGR